MRKSLKDQYTEIGIAEQNLIGVSAGLSNEGLDVIATTFAPFLTMRACEQIRINAGYMKIKLILVGLASGLVLGPLGYTHCCIEDISIMRSIPNVTVLSPADSLETMKCVEESIKEKNSVYIRLTGSSNSEIVYKKDYNFKIGKAIKLYDKGNDLHIFATGTMVSQALKLAELFREINVLCTVFNFHTIKPIDKNVILQSSKQAKKIITIEEHSLIGGLYSAVAEEIVKIKNNVEVIPFGIKDQYTNSGDYKFMLSNNNLEARRMFKIIKDEQ